MESEKIVRMRKLLASLVNPDVSQFIDIDRLVRSAIFSELTEMALHHAKQHGDLTYMNKMLDLLESSNHEEKLLDFFSSHIGFEVISAKGSLQLRKAPLINAAPMPFATAFPPASKARTAGLNKPPSKASPAPSVKKRKKPKKIDLLDSHAMLPGSFGHGKRK